MGAGIGCRSSASGGGDAMRRRPDPVQHDHYGGDSVYAADVVAHGLIDIAGRCDTCGGRAAIAVTHDEQPTLRWCDDCLLAMDEENAL